MSEEEQTEDEPSIEEILDSIRQIISEDDEDNEDDVVKENQEAEPTPEPEVEDAGKELDQSAIDNIGFDALNSDEDVSDEDVIDSIEDTKEDTKPETEDDVLELTEIVNIEDNQIEVDLQEKEEDVAEPEPEPEPEPHSVSLDENQDSLLTTTAETAAVTAITELVRKTAVERNGVTLEEIVRAELKPLLRDWLDKHLPTVIERLVQEELERVSKRVLEE